MLCDPMVGQVLTKSTNAAQSYLKKMSYEISSGFEEAFEREQQEEHEEEDEEEDEDNNLISLDIIRRSIVQGLGLQRIPDPSKVPLYTYGIPPEITTKCWPTFFP